MKKQINNDYYNHLGDTWYDADDDPIAILRAERKVKNPWVIERIKKHFKSQDIKIADIACGGGFLSNDLGEIFSEVHALDASNSSVETAKKNDISQKVNYIVGDAYDLPYENDSFDVVCTMDFLEHIDDPERVIKECSRILKPGGLFFYQTFNRNLLAWLVVIKFMEWFVPNTPKNLHVIHLFIKPKELQAMFDRINLNVVEWKGWGPRFNRHFIHSVFKRSVTKNFGFKVSNSLAIGYIGYAKKM